MNFTEYQRKALGTALPVTLEYPTGLYYAALGLASEAGEVAGKVKKFIRDGKLDREAVFAELGDVLWYCALLAEHLAYDLDGIASLNIDKLALRELHGTLQGSGDTR